MIVRPLDENGDMTPISNVDQMIGGTKAVAQVVRLRLNFLYGEWWEDPELGFRIPDFLRGGVRSDGVNLLAKYIATYVASTQGIKAVVDVSAEFENHNVKFYCLAKTSGGELTTVEVNLDGLL